MSSEGKRLTVDQRIAMRDAAHIRAGQQPGWPDDALNCYLSNIPVREILETYKISTKTFYEAIAKAALYRLMKERNCERMDEMEELTDAKA